MYADALKRERTPLSDRELADEVAQRLRLMTPEARREYLEDNGGLRPAPDQYAHLPAGVAADARTMRLPSKGDTDTEPAA
jgi:hypothetical protein